RPKSASAPSAERLRGCGSTFGSSKQPWPSVEIFSIGRRWMKGTASMSTTDDTVESLGEMLETALPSERDARNRLGAPPPRKRDPEPPETDEQRAFHKARVEGPRDNWDDRHLNFNEAV